MSLSEVITTLHLYNKATTSEAIMSKVITESSEAIMFKAITTITITESQLHESSEAINHNYTNHNSNNQNYMNHQRQLYMSIIKNTPHILKHYRFIPNPISLNGETHRVGGLI